MNRAIVLGAVTVASAVAVGAAAGGWAIGYGPFGHRSRTEGTGGTVPVATATVTRGTITVSEVDPGMVSYAGSFTVYGAGTGTVTWLPAAGAVIRPGARLFAVDGQDVAGQTVGDIAALIRGQPGTNVRLQVNRLNAPQPLEFTMKRAVVQVDQVIGRQVRSGAAELSMLRALGATPATVSSTCS